MQGGPDWGRMGCREGDRVMLSSRSMQSVRRTMSELRDQARPLEIRSTPGSSQKVASSQAAWLARYLKPRQGRLSATCQGLHPRVWQPATDLAATASCLLWAVVFCVVAELDGKACPPSQLAPWQPRQSCISLSRYGSSCDFSLQNPDRFPPTRMHLERSSRDSGTPVLGSRCKLSKQPWIKGRNDGDVVCVRHRRHVQAAPGVKADVEVTVVAFNTSRL